MPTAYKVYELNEDLSLGACVGGAQDEATAVTLATGFYVAVAAVYPDPARVIGVVDDAGSIAAWIGRKPEGVLDGP